MFWHGNLGGLKASGRHHSISIAKERASTKAKIVVISRVWSSCLQSCQSWLILESKLNGLLVSELVSRLYPNKTNKQQGHNQPRANLKQYDANMVCYAGCDMRCLCKIWQGMNEPGLNLEIQVCHWKDEMKSLENDIKNANRSYGLEMASDSNMTPVSDLQQVAI